MRALKRDWACVIAPVAAAVLFCLYYQRWPGTASFSLPISYLDGDDTLGLLGISKGFSELPAPWHLTVGRLNAPYGADWNDYPHSEKLIWYAWGILQRWLDVGAAANLMLLIAHVGAAFSFSWVGRTWGFRNATVTVGALLLVTSQFMALRALRHLNIVFIWHVPLLLLLTLWIARAERPPERKGVLAACALVCAMGLQNPYYPPLFLQLLGFATLRAWLLGRRSVARFGGIVIAVALASFFIGQLNVYVHAFSAGHNPAFSGRSLEELRLWSLRLPDLFLPWSHPMKAWQDFAQTHYFGAGNPQTENASAFLGVTGCALLLTLIVHSVSHGLRGAADEISWEAWVALYVLLVALAGGINYLLGALGITWLRSVNRYSIVLLCVLLFWGCRIVDRLERESRRTALLVGALAFGLFEFFGARPEDLARQTEQIRGDVASDREFAQALERQLPSAAAVFELPVMGFPEAAPIEKMAGYEPFRPYLWSQSLRFSYGTHRGRPRERWQAEIQAAPPESLCVELRRRGFSALIVNRRGFADGARGLEAELSRLALKHLVTSSAGDWVAYRL